MRREFMFTRVKNFFYNSISYENINQFKCSTFNIN